MAGASSLTSISSQVVVGRCLCALYACFAVCRSGSFPRSLRI